MINCYCITNYHLWLELNSVVIWQLSCIHPTICFMCVCLCMCLSTVCVCVRACGLYRHCGYSKAFQDSDEEKMHYQNGHGMCGSFFNYYQQQIIFLKELPFSSPCNKAHPQSKQLSSRSESLQQHTSLMPCIIYSAPSVCLPVSPFSSSFPSTHQWQGLRCDVALIPWYVTKC